VIPLIDRRKDWLWTTLLGALGAAVLISAFGASFFPVKSDELTVAWMAKQAAMGRVPYADFFCFIPPLTLYGLAAFFKTFGATLAVFRLLSVPWLLATTLLLQRLLRRGGMTPSWSTGTALLFPALFVPFWPVPSHHWFALGVGLASMAAADRAIAEESKALWFASGLLAGCSGLCLQTEGALFCLLLAGTFLLLAPRPLDRKAAVWALGGMALPLLIFAGVLAAQGALGNALYCLVVWPAKYYKQPGGFNDLNILSSVASEFARRWPAGGGFTGTMGFVSFLCALLVALWAPVSLAMSPAWATGTADNQARRRWTYGILGLLATLAAFLGGRAEWVHLTLFIPLLLVLCAREVDWKREHLRPLLFKGLLSVCLAACALRWIGVWVQKPPLLADILRVDTLVVENSVPSILAALPRVDGRLPSVVFLPHGADLYFYWAPIPPPVDWVEPPSFRYNAPGDYAALASFLVRERIPFVLVQANTEAMFLGQVSPLQSVLSSAYRPVRRDRLGLLLERKPDVPAAP